MALDDTTLPKFTGNFVGDPASVMAGIQNMKDPQERANALLAFNEQARRTPGFAGGASFAGTPATAAMGAPGAPAAVAPAPAALDSSTLAGVLQNQTPSGATPDFSRSLGALARSATTAPGYDPFGNPGALPTFSQSAPSAPPAAPPVVAGGAGGGPDRANPPAVTAAVKPPAAPRTRADAPAAPAFTPGVDGMEVIAGGQRFNAPWFTPFLASGNGAVAGLGGSGMPAPDGRGGVMVADAGAQGSGGAGASGGGYAGGGYAGGGYAGGGGAAPGLIDPSAGLQRSLSTQAGAAQDAMRAIMQAASEGDPRNYTARLHALASAYFGGAMGGHGMQGVNSYNAAAAGIKEAGIHGDASVTAAGIGGAAGVREAELGLQGRQAEAGAQLGVAGIQAETQRGLPHVIGEEPNVPGNPLMGMHNVYGQSPQAGGMPTPITKPPAVLKPGTIVKDASGARRKYMGGPQLDPSSYQPVD